MSKNVRFYIGIDSGGTKCEILITDQDKKKLFLKKFDGVHYSVVGAEKYSSEVSKFITSSLKSSELSLKNCLGICFGVAGAREETDRKKLTTAFQKKISFKKILVTTDAMTALFGALGHEDGIILISGTGCVLYGRSKDKIIRVGGWGRIIGDEGSGYWLGKNGLNAVAKEYDREPINKSKSFLRKSIERNFNITRENLNRKVFEKDFEIQKAAPIVLKSAGRKEKMSLEIVNEGIDGLFYLVKTYLQLSKRKQKIGIAYIGSIVENENILSKKLTQRIHSELKIVKVVKKKSSSSSGAIYLAEKEFTR